MPFVHLSCIAALCLLSAGAAAQCWRGPACVGGGGDPTSAEDDTSWGFVASEFALAAQALLLLCAGPGPPAASAFLQLACLLEIVGYALAVVSHGPWHTALKAVGPNLGGTSEFTAGLAIATGLFRLLAAHFGFTETHKGTDGQGVHPEYILTAFAVVVLSVLGVWALAHLHGSGLARYCAIMLRVSMLAPLAGYAAAAGATSSAVLMLVSYGLAELVRRTNPPPFAQSQEYNSRALSNTLMLFVQVGLMIYFDAMATGADSQPYGKITKDLYYEREPCEQCDFCPCEQDDFCCGSDRGPRNWRRLPV